MDGADMSGIFDTILTELQNYGLVVGFPNILIGLAFCFFGLRLFKCILFMIGFSIFFGATTFLLFAATKSAAAALAVGFLAGIGGGFLMMWLRKVIYFMFGLSFGCCISLALNIFLILPNINPKDADTAIIVTTIIFALLGGIFGLWIGDLIVIITTAVSGSLQMTFGTLLCAFVAFFAHGGDYKVFCGVLILEFVALALLGMWFQNTRKEKWRAYYDIHNVNVINNNISNDVSNNNNISINLSPQQYPGMMYPQQGAVPFMAPQSQPHQQGVELKETPHSQNYVQPSIYAKPQEV